MTIRLRKTEIDKISLRKKILKKIDAVLLDKKIMMGPRISRTEKKLSNFLNSPYSLLTSSGSDSIFMSLMCLDLKPGDEIITTPLSWVTSATPIMMLNLKPIFVDIDNNLNINVNKIEKQITKKTKAILIVHFTGRACDMKKILYLKKKYKLYLIEDCSQAFGSKYDNKYCGTFGDFGCFSMNPMKNLSAYGEAGLITVKNIKYYRKLKLLRYAGTKNKEFCYFPSSNFKPDTLQTVFLENSLINLNKKLKQKNNIAKLYRKNLTKKLKFQITDKKYKHSYYSFVIYCNQRDKLVKYLKKRRIETKIEHPILIPNQVAFKKKYKYKKLEFPVANNLVKKILSIPIREDLKNSEINFIINSINKFYD
ncbi:DegT/DnrJ/EryC1/StrS family aminotransferase [Candidatus Pelagibacter sp.]|nr:DegT/DnrJ/EryC1/StrS family aminotransferase [Candidatus Pelagibacter sp.]